MTRQLSVRGEHRIDQAHDAFDPIEIGAEYGLAPEVSRAIWARIQHEPHAEARFAIVASHVAARGGRLHPAPGKVTALDAARAGRDVFAGFVPGQRTRSQAVQRRARKPPTWCRLHAIRVAI